MKKISIIIVLFCIHISVFAQNDFPWSNAVPAVVAISDTTGCANATYTFSLRTGTNTITRIRSYSQGGNAGIAEITFPAGTAFGTLSGTMKGVAINVASFVITGTKVTFEVPGNDAIFINNNENFTIVLNNIFNPSSGTYSFTGGTAANARVRVFNSQGGWNYNGCDIGNNTPTTSNCSTRNFKISSCPPGSTCGDPFVVSSLPFYQANMATCGFGNDYSTTPCAANAFMGGEDFIFTYNSPGNECISIYLENTAVRTGLFLLDNCPNAGGGNCIAQSTPTGGNPSVSNIYLNAPGTYYIVVSTNPNPTCTPFDIYIEQNQAPSNDAPCDAWQLDLGIFVGGNNSCSGNFGEPANPSCWSAGTINSVWYKFVAPASGQVKIRTLGNTLLNTQIAVYQGGCNNLTLLSTGCNDDGPSCGSTADLSSRLSLTGLTPGATYYVRVDGANELVGSFNIIVVDGNSSFPGAYGQECGVEYSLPLCSPTYTVANQTYNGIGNTCDFPGGNGNCLASAERGSTWFTIPISANGNLTFDIIPNDYTGGAPGAETDYDYAIWKIKGTGAVNCDGIAAGAVPIRCNYSALGVTGLFGTANGVSPTAYPGFGGAYMSQLPVVAGEVYALVVSNFSLSGSGYVLQIGASSPVLYQNSANPPKFVVWSGTISDDWNNPENWGGCGIPSCDISAKISSTANIQPVITTNVTCKDLQIAAGARVTINPNVTLSLCGSIENLGAFRAGVGSSVQFIGDTIQAISGNFTAADQFFNLTVAKTDGKVRAYQQMTVRGNFTTQNANSLFDLAGHNLVVGGDFYIAPISGGNSTFNSGIGGEVLFNGASKPLQQYTNIDTIDAIVMANYTDGIELQTNMIIGLKPNSGSLTLNNGIIKTHSNEVIVVNRTPNSVTAGNNDSYVQGDLRRYLNSTGSYHFPVGDSTKGYQLANFNFTVATTISNLRANFKPWGGAEPLPTPLGVSGCNGIFNLDALDNGYWTVDAFNSSGALVAGDGTYTATLYNRPGSYTNPGFIVTVQKKPSTGGVWTLQGNCATSNVNQVVRTGMTGFSKFSTAQGEEPEIYISMPDTVCGNNNPFTITTFPTSGTFMSSSPGHNNGTFTPSLATAGYNYVTFSDTINGTITSITDSVFVIFAPSATITALSDTSFCDGGKVKLLANVPAAGLTYQWYYNGVPIADSTNYTFTANVSGMYHFVIKRFDGCPDTSRAIQVSSNPYPNPIINSAGNLFCKGDTLVLNSDSTTGNTYQWYLNGALISGATNVGYAATLPGNYIVAVTNAFQCKDTSTVLSINYHSMPNTLISNLSDTVFCRGGNVILTAFDSPSYIYHWLLNRDTIALAYNDSLIVTTPGLYSVYVIDTNALCPDTSRQILVSYHPNPTGIISVADSILCEGEFTAIQASGGINYQWYHNGAIITGATNPVFNTDSAGSYSFITENNFGCKDTSSVVQIIVNPLPNAVITSTATMFCPLDTLILSANIASGLTYQWYFNGNIIAGAINSSYNATLAGNYTVVETNQFQCKDTSNIITLGYFSLPNVSVSSVGDTTFCIGGNVAIVAAFNTNYTYQWMLNGANIAGATNDTLIATQAGNYSVVVVDPSEACPNVSRNVIVGYHSNPIAQITATSDTSICVGFNASLQASGGTNYQWLNNGAIISGAVNQNYTTINAGNYSVIAYNSFGCADTSRVIGVNVNPLPIASISSTDTVFCEGENIVFNAVSNTNSTYQWLFNNTPITGETGVSLSTNMQGLFSVIETSQFGCKDTSNVMVSIKNNRPIATISIDNDTTLCPSETIILTTNGSMSNYTWYFNNAIISSANSSEVTVSGAGNYFAIITDANGCKDTTRVVTVLANPLPDVTLSYNDTTVCAGLTSVFSVTGGSGYNYQWYYNNSIISGATNPYYQASQTGNYFVVVTNDLGCKDTSRVISSTQIAYPIAEIIVADSTACEGNTVMISAYNPTFGDFTYQWFKDNLIINGAINLIYYASQTGNYHIEVTNSEGCTQVLRNVNVEIYPKPVASIAAIGSPNLCSGENVTLQTANTGTYQWMINNSYISGENTNQIVLNTAGVYALELTSANGCKDTSNVITVQVSTYPVINLTSNAPNNQVCSGNTVTISTSLQSTYSYVWYRNDAVIANFNSNTITTTLSGEYKVKVTNNGLCSSTDSLVLNINPLPSVSSGLGALICRGEEFKLSGVTNASNYIWKEENGGFVTDTTLSPIVKPIETTNYILSVVDNNGCTNSSSVQVRVKAGIKPIIYVDYDAGVVPFRIKFYNGSTNADKFIWDFGDGATSEEKEPTHEYTTVGDFAVTLTAVSGSCMEDTVYNFIHVIDLKIPSAISPNGDNVNDKWIIDKIEFFPNNEVEIFNQWGNLVYKQKGYTNDWSAEKLADGTYFYILRLGNEINPINGYIMIMR